MGEGDESNKCAICLPSAQATGPDISQDDPPCEDAKLDPDDDVDQSDSGFFQCCYSGMGMLVDSNCMDRAYSDACSSRKLRERWLDISPTAVAGRPTRSDAPVPGSDYDAADSSALKLSAEMRSGDWTTTTFTEGLRSARQSLHWRFSALT